MDLPQSAKTTNELIKINAGGACGFCSHVQKDSDKVWKSVKDKPLAQDWLKANLKVVEDDQNPWFVKVNKGKSPANSNENKVYFFWKSNEAKKSKINQHFSI